MLCFVSCKKKTRGSMMVIKSCEGTYVRFNDLDYTICNEYSLNTYENGSMVNATIVRDDKCENVNIHCAVVHPQPTADGLYNVIKVSR
jgi:hypothetical protein